MQTKLNQSKGFTLVELLVVLVIIAILAAVAAPIYQANTQRAKASEAVSSMSSIRQAMRDYVAAGGSYFTIGTGTSFAGAIQNALPTNVSSGTPTPGTAGVAVDTGVARYFSNGAYTVTAPAPSDAQFGTSPAPVDFIIYANGVNSQACGTSFCATNNTEVSTFRLKMDNSGRTFVSYDNGNNWAQY